LLQFYDPDGVSVYRKVCKGFEDLKRFDKASVEIMCRQVCGYAALGGTFASLIISSSHRTVISLEYPPHCVALACIYLAGLLASFEVGASSVSDELIRTKSMVDALSESGDWEGRYLVQVDDLEGAAF
jgi:hypothetical protein